MSEYNTNLHCNLSYSIMSSKEKGDSTMSIMLMGFNETGAVIATDSRETFNDGFFSDKKIKVHTNDNIIVGQVGINFITRNNKRIDLAKIIIDNLLNGMSIIDAVQIKIDGVSIKELIPDENSITFFYAKKCGEVGVYDITKNENLENKCNNSFGLYKNVYTSTKPFVDIILNRTQDIPNNTICSMEQKIKFIIQEVLNFEANLEKFTGRISAVGGKIQIASIKF